MTRLLHRALIRACLTLMMALPWLPARAAETYTWAVVPQFEQRKLFAIWKPIVDELARRTGLHLQLVAALTVAQFEGDLKRGTFDFVYANPFHIFHIRPNQGYIPLVRDAVPLTGIIVVARDSPVHEVAQLDGKLLAIPSPNAMGASLMVRADLDRLFHVKVRLLDAKTHSSVYLHVANGLADAGGGVQKSLEEQPDDVLAALRVLYRTREIPSHPIAAHPRVPEAVREVVKDALLAMAQDPAGRALLAEIPMTQPVAASLDDYQVMAGWRLGDYWVDQGGGR